MNMCILQQEEYIRIQNPTIGWNEDAGEGLKILGIHFFKDAVHMTNYNWKKVIKKLKAKTDFLKLRANYPSAGK